ncbi:glutathione S-transferase theta-1b [Austrofundulus limnaeus]|uniref:glutathione transferase n=1 Tax=Austrofundulus limnaeus TaxID=52670 RepID=A0A2I4CNU7_AUSLI|nr:PREDICTED: glutathione S-transferase theta-1-like [Austrofundulus limnaeus]
MSVELYLDLFSQPCRSVYIFAKKNNIPFEFKKVSLFHGEHFGDDFGKISLIRKVPALRDGDFCLAESVAILIYLAEKFRTPDSWYPADVRQRARVHEYLSWQHSAMRWHGVRIFWLRVMIPVVLGVEVPQEKMDTALEDLNASLDLFQDKFLQDRAFVVGDRMSLADLVAIVEMMQPVAAGLDIFEDRPKLSAWRDRVQAAIGKELFDEAHRTIMESQETVKVMDGSTLKRFTPKILRMFM